MLSKSMEYVVVDVETTGLSPADGDRIIEIGAVKFRNGVIVDSLQSLINPQRDIPVEAQRVNNITPDMLVNAPTALEFLPRWIDFAGNSCLVGHNVKFDLDFICHELARMGRRLNADLPALDTLKMARYFLPHLKSHRLAIIANVLGIKVEETHRALADVELTAQILSRFLDLAGRQGMSSFSDFHKSFNIPLPKYQFQTQQQAMLF